jgi:hypothetical protein
MISLIASVKDKEKLNKFLLPSINKTNDLLLSLDLPLIDFIEVSGSKSIAENYNAGIKRAKHKIIAFVHEDVDLLSPSWLFKILKVFASDITISLIGFIGTTKQSSSGFWWVSGKEYIFGRVIAGLERAIWDFNIVENDYIEVECVDGLFLATNKDIRFDENLLGFHCYDMDICRQVRKMNNKVVVVPHLVWHIGEIRENTGVKDLLEVYSKKWNNK